MHHLISPTHTPISYSKYGSGPPLVLVHGAFSDHNSNWEFVKPFFEQQFTVYAIARRGRGETAITNGHSLEDESMDVVALMQAIGKPVFLLGHSYGAQTALAAAAKVPTLVRKLVLYEALWPRILDQTALMRLELLAQAGKWSDFAVTFFHKQLFIPLEELEQLQTTEFWAPIVADAEASLGDLRALSQYNFQAEHFRDLQIPVMLQIGTESPRDLYVTDTLAAILPDVRIEELPGQAHEGMTTAPVMYAAVVTRFFLT